MPASLADSTLAGRLDEVLALRELVAAAELPKGLRPGLTGAVD